ncbi:YveK family protein [Evansella sp. AB-rgal1]|uniref:YveK family protein n=1 Tax=Evansella sp. AB-rgal1 TaxID=3242696 RepID=UPI00359E07A6
MKEMNSFKEILLAMKKRLWLIIIMAIGAGAVSGFYTNYYVTPVYQTSSQFLVSNSGEGQTAYDPGQLNTNIQLISTYNEIIRSPRILDIVSEELGTYVSAGQITVSNNRNSQVVHVTAFDSDPGRAITIANTTVEVFQQEVPKLLQVDNVNILSVATNAFKVSPSLITNVSIAVALGLILGVGITLLFEFFDNTIKSEESIEELLDLPLLGVVSHCDHKAKPVQEKPRSA